MILSIYNLLFQGSLNPSKGRFATPYDSTQGVGTGFYWFSLAVLVFIFIGVARLYWNDASWRNRFLQRRWV